jgi:oxygen-independent coproporphyrinogen-3 oxidase
LLKDILLNAGYSRYEISNFALAGKSSIHNRVYWNMENYL